MFFFYFFQKQKTSQYRRGGGTVCTKNEALWEKFRALATKFNAC